MKQIRNLSLFFSLILALIAFPSCKDDDSVTTDEELPTSLVTTYTGTLTYTSTAGDITANLSGTATIELDGSEYDINFSDGVPSISGLAFVESDGAYATSSTSLTGISIDGDDLKIASTQNGNVWAFSGSK